MTVEVNLTTKIIQRITLLVLKHNIYKGLPNYVFQSFWPVVLINMFNDSVFKISVMSFWYLFFDNLFFEPWINRRAVIDKFKQQNNVLKEH